MGQFIINIDLCVISLGLNGCGTWREDRNQAGQENPDNSLWSLLLDTWQPYHPRVWEQDKDSGVNKHPHCQTPHRHDHHRLSRSV